MLHIPGCKVHLMDKGEALELADGDFRLVRISADNRTLATIIKVGNDIQWPLTKDEPVVKFDNNHYVFSLPLQDGDPLSYGVRFPEQKRAIVDLLDSLLKERSCFSTLPSSTRNKDVNWEEFAPRISDYNNVLARAIAEGTGQIVNGIFKISNIYANQVQKGVEMMQTAAGQNNGASSGETKTKKKTNASAKGGSNINLKRARKLSEKTENLSNSVLFEVTAASGSAMKPVFQSQVAKAFLATAPGEVILASLDAINKVLDAAEAAEKQAVSATSIAATSMITKRFGESAGEATEDVLATAGHCAGTAWNAVKIRKAVLPSSAATSGMLKSAAKK